MSVKAELLVVSALQAWLLNQLPAKVTEVNADRAPRLQTPTAGPFDIPRGAIARVSTTAFEYSQNPDDFAEVPLTSGTGRTAAQLADDFNAAVAGIAAVESVFGCLELAGSAPSGTDSNGSIAVAPDTSGANAALGWSQGGERVVRAPIVTPTPSAMLDGWPSGGIPPEGQSGMVVVLGDRSSKGVYPIVRRDEYWVTVDLELMSFRLPGENYRSREHVASCLRCVREVLSTTDGRYLGRKSLGDVLNVDLTAGARIAGAAFRFAGGSEKSNPLFDAALMSVAVKIFERPASS